MSNIINLKRIGCFVESFQREILPKDIDISGKENVRTSLIFVMQYKSITLPTIPPDNRYADDDVEMLSKGTALLEILKSLEATIAVMSAVSASLAITLKMRQSGSPLNGVICSIQTRIYILIYS